MCAKLDNMTDLIHRKCEKFVDQLIGDGRITNEFFSIALMHFVICNFDVCSICVFVCVSTFVFFNFSVLFAAFIC